MNSINYMQTLIDLPDTYKAGITALCSIAVVLLMMHLQRMQNKRMQVLLEKLLVQPKTQTALKEMDSRIAEMTPNRGDHITITAIYGTPRYRLSVFSEWNISGHTYGIYQGDTVEDVISCAYRTYKSQKNYEHNTKPRTA